MAGAEIDITWESSNKFVPFPRGLASDALGDENVQVEGEAVIVTDENGQGTLDIDVSEFEAFLAPFQDTIKVEATFVGPTRERI